MYERRPSEPLAAPLALRLWRFRPTLLRRACRHLPSLAWAEDAVAETLLAALEQAHALDRLDCLEAWLGGVLRHKIADQLRANRLAWAGDATAADAAEGADTSAWACPHAQGPAHPAPEAVVELRQWRAHIERQLPRLPPLQAQALRLHLAWDAGATEIAAALGISANHSGVLLHRARRRLQDLLPPWVPG
jgi:RNA polymerase sigma-70 factor, ECF subfamily